MLSNSRKDIHNPSWTAGPSHVGLIHRDIHNSFSRVSKTFCTFLAHRNVHAIFHLYVSELLMFLLLARYAIAAISGPGTMRGSGARE
jgi:hypothetical protein